MSVTAIILSHYKEREQNLNRIVNDLRHGSVVPDEILVICDNPEIEINVDVETFRISRPVLPIIRFVIGSMLDTDYCLFIDDDLTVGKNTLQQFKSYASHFPDAVLGFEGNTNGQMYTDGESIGIVKDPVPTDIIIRIYFAPVSILSCALQMKSLNPRLPKVSMDDILLCLGNKYINNNQNFVIPETPESRLTELSTGGVGQYLNPDHFRNRDMAVGYFKRKFKR